LVDKIFNGLDQSYIYHKYLSILAIILIWVHVSTLRIGGGRSFRRPPSGTMNSLINTHLMGRMFATLSIFLFTAFVVIFLVAYKLEYQKWKNIHKLMLIPYVFGVIHYYLNSQYAVFSLSAYSLWMNLANAIGIGTALYSIFLYEKTAFPYRYQVKTIKKVARDTIEITGTSSSKEMKYKPGQFAFMKVLGRKKNFPSHPFTISQAPKAGEIQFTVKALGDHTGNLTNNLALGDTIAVSGPFGRFDYKSGAKHQIWIAGGTGITPFRSFLQSAIPADYRIDFFYAYNNVEEGAYVDEIKALEHQGNLRIHLLDSSISGFLGRKDFEEHLSKNEEYDVFFCGPKVMRQKISKGLKAGGFNIRDFRYEHFQFK
jgi:predicted ferric reductase